MRRILPITTALVLATATAAASGGPRSYDPRNSGPVSDRFIPAVTRPASTRPASRRPLARPALTRPATARAGEVDEAWVNPAATEFLRAVSAGEDERAYQLTSADYRAAHPPAEF